MLRELALFSLEKKMFQGELVAFQYFKGACKKMRKRDFLQRAVVTMVLN